MAHAQGTVINNGHANVPAATLTKQQKKTLKKAKPPPTPVPEAERMKRGPRIAVAVWLIVLSILSVGHLIWMWSVASRLVPATTGGTQHIRVHWIWLGFVPTLETSLVLLVMLAALAGSAAHMSLVFANRAGHKTLEATWWWWYYLRPLAAAIVGVVTYVVLKAGFLGTVSSTDQHSLAFAAGVGALAGLFTDTLIKKLAKSLGATPFDKPAATATDSAGD